MIEVLCMKFVGVYRQRDGCQWELLTNDGSFWMGASGLENWF